MAPKKKTEIPKETGDGQPPAPKRSRKKTDKQPSETPTSTPAVSPTELPVETPPPEVPAPVETPAPKRKGQKRVKEGTEAKADENTAKAAKATVPVDEAPAEGGAAAGLPPPEPTWENFEKLKQHFQLTDDEAHAVLTGLCGPKPEPTPEVVEKSVEVEEPLDGFPWNEHDNEDEDEDEEEEDSPTHVPTVPVKAEPKNTEESLQALTVRTVATPQVWYSKMFVVPLGNIRCLKFKPQQISIMVYSLVSGGHSPSGCPTTC